MKPVQVCLLRSPRVITHEGPADITGQQWAVLETLTLKARDDVPAGDLARGVWGDSPPPSADVTLRGLVADLRRTLGDNDHTLIVTVPGRRKEQKSAYRLNLSRDSIDLFVFEDLCQSGRALMRAGEWTKAHATLTDAAALGRGTSFTGFSSSHLLGEYLPYLEELLAQAQEARLESLVRLSLREAAGAVPDLRRLVAVYPDREKPRTLLMLALCRAGRHRDAVNAFLQWRDYSLDEIGAKPGPGIQSVNDRITRQDETLLTEPLGFDLLP